MNLLDDDLRTRFAALRDHDAETAPGFDAVRRRVGPHLALGGRARWRYAALAASALVLSVAVTAWLVPAVHPAGSGEVASAWPAWRTPTDALLAGAGDDTPASGWQTLPTAHLDRPFLPQEHR